MIRKRKGYGLILPVLGLIFAGCDLINPPEEVPAYIYIPDLHLETNAALQGSTSAKMTEVWITTGETFLGAYSLPALVPVLARGKTTLMLEAGIKDNGITARPEIYPFYAPFTMQIDLQPEQIDTLRPIIRYRDGISFAFIEDFEKGAHLFEQLRQGSDINRMVIEEEGAFEGLYSGKLFLDKEHPLVELATVESFRQLSDRGFQVYLELNYRSEVPVVFGLIGKNQHDPDSDFAVYDPGFLPSEEWNKIYFNLSLLVLDNPFDEYQVSLQAFLSAPNGNLDNATVWLDNIKLIHF